MKVALNGFGRIGRSFLRSILGDEHAKKVIDVVAINQGPCPAEYLDVLFKHDSVMGTFPGSVSLEGNTLVIDGKKILIFSQAKPEDLDWKGLGVDWVVEASGCFTTRDCAGGHLKAGAQKVLITAPSPDADVAIIPGVNDADYDHGSHDLVSLGSCTTNCFVPLVKVIKDAFGIQSGIMTTIHSYTNNQSLLDGAHSDPRRARAAALNLIPTKTGASKLITKIFPDLQGKITALAVRAPVANISLVAFTFVPNAGITTDQLNQLFYDAAQGNFKNIIAYSDQPLVSSDYIGDPHSAVFDSLLTKTAENMHEIFAWYDNEYGYACRLKDFLLHNLKKFN